MTVAKGNIIPFSNMILLSSQNLMRQNVFNVFETHGAHHPKIQYQR